MSDTLRLVTETRSVVVDPAVRDVIADHIVESWTEDVARVAPVISARQRQILRSLGAGLTEVAAAKDASISVRTLHRELEALKVQTGAASTFELMALAQRVGLLG